MQEDKDAIDARLIFAGLDAQASAASAALAAQSLAMVLQADRFRMAG